MICERLVLTFDMLFCNKISRRHQLHNGSMLFKNAVLKDQIFFLTEPNIYNRTDRKILPSVGNTTAPPPHLLDEPLLAFSIFFSFFTWSTCFSLGTTSTGLLTIHSIISVSSLSSLNPVLWIRNLGLMTNNRKFYRRRKFAYFWIKNCNMSFHRPAWRTSKLQATPPCSPQKRTSSTSKKYIF
jgi:hypothetical protein